jgi:hypothetical protein
VRDAWSRRRPDVVPSKDLVTVHRVANDNDNSVSVSYQDSDVMIRLIIAAAPPK